MQRRDRQRWVAAVATLLAATSAQAAHAAAVDDGAAVAVADQAVTPPVPDADVGATPAPAELPSEPPLPDGGDAAVAATPDASVATPDDGTVAADAALPADPAIADAALPDPAMADACAGAPGDPLEGFNRAMFRIGDGIDRAVFRPLALGTSHIIPQPLRDGLRNFFRNLTEPLVIINSLLQGRFALAGRAFKRFFINSTLGLGGVLDVAAHDGLRHENNGFGNTLARWGVGPGPYLFVPLIGPTTLRDLLGGQADGVVLPVAVGRPFNRFDYQTVRAVSTAIDQRIENDANYTALLAGAADPYATLRSVYLQNRAAEVQALRGGGDAAPPSLLDGPLDDPGAGAVPAC